MVGARHAVRFPDTQRDLTQDAAPSLFLVAFLDPDGRWLSLGLATLDSVTPIPN